MFLASCIAELQRLRDFCRFYREIAGVGLMFPRADWPVAVEYPGYPVIRLRRIEGPNAPTASASRRNLGTRTSERRLDMFLRMHRQRVTGRTSSMSASGHRSAHVGAVAGDGRYACSPGSGGPGLSANARHGHRTPSPAPRAGRLVQTASGCGKAPGTWRIALRRR
jgi:hypothetical protein